MKKLFTFMLLQRYVGILDWALKILKQNRKAQVDKRKEYGNESNTQTRLQSKNVPWFPRKTRKQSLDTRKNNFWFSNIDKTLNSLAKKQKKEMKTRGEGLSEPEIKRLMLSSPPYTVKSKLKRPLGYPIFI